ncbi:MAG: glycogen/starch/alpha-glucan phosphorylase, partial [Spirochaetia bacterium]|nr:glycogen/starch/alpha-glucan phosphorylase [Spirochaetia bacterium]
MIENLADSSKSKAAPKTSSSLIENINRQIISVLGNDYSPPRIDTFFKGLCFCVRDRIIETWLKAQRSYYSKHLKRVYYLSMEFLPGPFLKSYINSLQMSPEIEEALKDTGFDLENLAEQESEPGLGNGGLGRLASCYMDSMANLNIPAYGYGIRYDYGIFQQKIIDGYQVEICDNWLSRGNPWQIERRNFLYTVQFYGRSESYLNDRGEIKYRWADSEIAHAMACDILIPAHNSESVINMRLWQAMSGTDFDLSFYNNGDYIRAMQEKVLTENITKVLYPGDEPEEGKELRLKQQYFLVAATFDDLIRRFKKMEMDFDSLPDQAAVQLNDTHPSISIAELMRILIDEENLEWDRAWNISVRTFAYTNHTILPEALETWPVSLMEKVLPRHMQIIYEINFRFLEELKKRYPGNAEILSRLSIIQEGREKRVRMAHLAIVGSHTVNGVAALHSQILKDSLFKEFHEFYPGKFINVTNGITQRRWLLQANPSLSELITQKIGDDWICDLSSLKKLIPFSENSEFQNLWKQVKNANKIKLADYIKKETGVEVIENSLFDVQSKRFHEYKRQMLNILHVITLFNRILENSDYGYVPRTVMIAGKAAPGYYLAKLTIKLINDIAKKINANPKTNSLLRLVFLPNYCVSQAEKLASAADLSEQISMAGMEASGTGNMKFALNGSLIIGTLDGANIEIMEEVGEENIFIFGLKTDEVRNLKAKGYNPY